MEFSHDRSHMLRRTRAVGRHARRLALTGVLVALALPATALAAKRFTIRAHFPNHAPIAKQLWPIRLMVTKGTAKLSGSVRYEFEFNGTVVSKQPGHRFTRGLYRDKLLFPLKSVGEPLTLVVVVKTRYGTEDVDWAVKTRR